MTGPSRSAGFAATANAGIVALAVLTVGFVLLLVSQVSNRTATDLLGPYPVQTVTNRVPGIDGPAAREGETMVITGTLCNRTKKPVDVRTTLQWQAVGRTGTFVTVATDIAQTRKPGCESFAGANAFRNPMPAEVIAATRTVRASGVAHVYWVVTGWEIPVDDGDEREVFVSQPFEVVP